MRKNISILEVTQKTSKTGNYYWSCKTDQGNISCFDPVLGKQLTEGKGKILDCEIEVNGQYTNILAIFEEVGVVTQSNEREGGPAEGARLRRVTDCILKSADMCLADKIPMENIHEHAKALYAMIGEIDANPV